MTNILSDILAFVVSPAFIANWIGRYLLGWPTPFDKCIPNRPSLQKIILLGVCKRLEAARFLGVKGQNPKLLRDTMLKVECYFAKYAHAEKEFGNWLVKPYDFDPTVDPCLVYVHGGGFMLRADPGQVEYCKRLYESLVYKDPKKFANMAVLMIDYRTTYDGKRFPTQLNHMIDAWKNLIDQGFQNLYIVGDSAGGTLCINLLQWLTEQPEDGIVWPKKALLISPCVTVLSESSDTGLSMENARYDICNPYTGNPFGKAYTKDVENPWNNKYLNVLYNIEQTDWAKIETDMKCIVGSHELMAKGIIEFSRLAGADLAIEDGGVHDGSLVYEIPLYSRKDWLSAFGAKTAIEFFTS